MNAASAPNFSSVTYVDALARARALIPQLRAQAEQGEAERRIPESSLSALHASGLLRILQPRRWGGMELPYAALFDVPELLARGDASVAWTLGNLAIHHWMLALYDPRAQEEVWGADPQALIAGGIAFPQGAGRKVDGESRKACNWAAVSPGACKASRRPASAPLPVVSSCRCFAGGTAASHCACADKSGLPPAPAWSP